MNIKRFTFGPFGTNTYVVSDPNKQAILIDCAAFDTFERDALSNYLRGEQLTPIRLICTHGHLDHLWGAQWACEQFGLTAGIHPDDYRQIENLARQQAAFGITPRETDFPYQEMKALPGWKILHTPGHTQGSVCLYNEAEHLLFSGDTLFAGGYGRTDLPEGNYEALMQSLSVLATLPPHTRVLPGHGPETTIGREQPA